jgi:hypothetical protein
MLILEKPYVSNLLAECAVKNQLPILRNAMSEKMEQKGYKLNLLNDTEFKAAYDKRGRLYTMSENALEWVYKHLSSTDLVNKIELLKNKSEFRRLCSSIYPDFYFKELPLQELYNLSVSDLKLPLVIKPSVGFLSAGVYVVSNETEWNNALADIKANFRKISHQFPDFVVGDESFLLEEYIKGDEFAVDAYFDEAGKPVILNVFHHRFASESDVSDRLYCTSKAIYDKYFNEFYDFLVRINKLLGLHDFPMHIEFRYDGKMAIPIEINPLRFAGFCLNELQVHISGIHPVMAYLNNVKPDYEQMWNGRETDVFSFLVFERPTGLADDIKLDKEKLRAAFSNVLELRPVDEAPVGVFATMFTKTDKDHVDELDRALILNMNNFCMK